MGASKSFGYSIAHSREVNGIFDGGRLFHMNLGLKLSKPMKIKLFPEGKVQKFE